MEDCAADAEAKRLVYGENIVLLHSIFEERAKDSLVHEIKIH